LASPYVQSQLTPEQRDYVNAGLVGIQGGLIATTAFTEIQDRIARDFIRANKDLVQRSIYATRRQREMAAILRAEARGLRARARGLSRALGYSSLALEGGMLMAAGTDALSGRAGYSKPAMAGAAAAALWIYPPAGMAATGALGTMEVLGVSNEFSFWIDGLFE